MPGLFLCHIIDSLLPGQPDLLSVGLMSDILHLICVHLIAGQTAGYAEMDLVISMRLFKTGSMLQHVTNDAEA